MPPKRRSQKAAGTPSSTSTLQAQLNERNEMLEAQERRINELTALLAAQSNEPAGSNNVEPENANTDMTNEGEDKDLDIPVGPGAGLAPRTNNIALNTTGATSAAAQAGAISTASVPVATVVPVPAPVPPAHAPAPAAIAPIPEPAPAVIPNAAPLVPQPTNISAPGVGGKIRHPGGRVNRGCQLREAMGLGDNICLYLNIHITQDDVGRSVRELTHQHPLEQARPARFGYHHDLGKSSNKLPFAYETNLSCFEVVNAYPYLRRFEPPAWPVLEMIKTLVRNKRAYQWKVHLNPPNDSDGGFDPVPDA
ncbi:hypothetical protein FRC07_003560 [Ceratobasidium sp. 392]|nr:hypothetical protein FRC07_003560 [Ceratobasidium sp. 392]